MIPPDKEIHEVEQRLALRRTQIARHSRETASRTLQALASPPALIGAAALGFIAARRFSSRRKEPPHPERRKTDHLKAAKATGFVGVLTTAAMWFIKAQYGSPLQLAQTLLQKFHGARNRPSPRGDVRASANPRS